MAKAIGVSHRSVQRVWAGDPRGRSQTVSPDVWRRGDFSHRGGHDHSLEICEHRAAVMADDTEACRRFEILEFVGAELSGSIRE
jgi:hypothetical protein